MYFLSFWFCDSTLCIKCSKQVKGKMCSLLWSPSCLMDEWRFFPRLHASPPPPPPQPICMHTVLGLFTRSRLNIGSSTIARCQLSNRRRGYYGWKEMLFPFSRIWENSRKFRFRTKCIAKIFQVFSSLNTEAPLSWKFRANHLTTNVFKKISRK